VERERLLISLGDLLWDPIASAFACWLRDKLAFHFPFASDADFTHMYVRLCVQGCVKAFDLHYPL
jgi:hypothetical protein